jgi:hypothetical protein
MTYDVRFSDGSIGYGLTQSDRDYWDSLGEIYTVIATHTAEPPASEEEEKGKSNSLLIPGAIAVGILALAFISRGKRG